jgi:hypothetical protein
MRVAISKKPMLENPAWLLRRDFKVWALVQTDPLPYVRAHERRPRKS